MIVTVADTDTDTCKTCGGTGIEHVCGADIECRDCRAERQRLQLEHQRDHDEDRAFGGHW